MRYKIFNIIQIGDKHDLPSRFFDDVLIIAILTNIAVLFLSTFDTLDYWRPMFSALERLTLLFFIGEFLLRIWTADFLYPAERPGQSQLRFLFSFEGMIDLLTILSSFFPAYVLSGFVALRLLRVARILQLFRLNAQYDSFSVIAAVFREKRNQILSSLVIIFILMCASSLCMYSAEHDAQPEVFRNAFSGLWWSMSTLLTVGYGDIYPITFLGQCMAILIAFMGVGVVAIPTGIISAGFVEQYSRRQNLTDYRKEDVEDIIEVAINEEILLADYREKTHLKLYLVLREGMSILPSGQLMLHPGDIVIANARSQ